MRKSRKRKFKSGAKGFFFILFILIVAGGFLLYQKNEELKEEKRIVNEKNLIAKIKGHFNDYVMTNKESNLYSKDGKIIGKINKDVYLVLDKTKIDKNTEYFKINNLEDHYIKYDDVDKTEEITKSDRYKKYIPYNQNVKTEKETTFYDEKGNFIYTISKPIDSPVIVKEKEYYGVEFDNQILYVKKDDVNLYDHHNTDKKNTNGAAVLNYHFFYEDGNPDGCNEVICAPKSQLKSHLDYFKEKNILTITMHELEMFMDGKIQLPKSVLITIDDGGRTKIAVDLITEYKMNATIFLISSWFDPKTYYKTDYIELHSHTHNLHIGGKCPGGQGSGLKCLDKAVLLDDLKKSRETLGGTTAMAYPFYEHNAYSREVVKEAGFTMAFIGEVTAPYGPYKLAEVGGDKLEIPRFAVVTFTTIDELNRYFNEIR